MDSNHLPPRYQHGALPVELAAQTLGEEPTPDQRSLVRRVIVRRPEKRATQARREPGRWTEGRARHDLMASVGRGSAAKVSEFITWFPDVATHSSRHQARRWRMSELRRYIVDAADARESTDGHQFHRPRSTATEGTSRVRTKNVSSKTANAMVKPSWRD